MHEPTAPRIVRGPARTLRDLTDQQLQTLTQLLVDIRLQQKRWLGMPTESAGQRLAQLLSLLVMLNMTFELPAAGATPALVVEEVRRRAGLPTS